jgi:amino acid transporter
VSKLAYSVREIALFADIVGLALLILVVIALIDVIWKILRGTNLSIDVGSGDHANGLGSVGSALQLFLPFFSVLAFIAVIGTVVHEGQDPQQVISDYLTLGVSMVLYFLLFVGPMLPVRQQVKAFLRNEVDRIRWRRQSLEGKSRAILDQSQQPSLQQTQLYEALSSICKLLQQQERKLRTATTWPIRRPTLVAAVSAGVLPGLIFVLLRVLWR